MARRTKRSDLHEDYPGQRIAGPDFDTRDREGLDPDLANDDDPILELADDDRAQPTDDYRIVSVPGRDDDDPCAWFVMEFRTHRTVGEAGSLDEARQLLRRVRKAGRA